MGKDYFLVSKDQIRGMEKSVSAEQFRAVIMAMLEIDDGMEPQVSDQVVAYIVNSKADQAKEHRKNWETKQKIARENGAKGGRPSKPTGTDKNPENQQEPVGTNQNQEKPIKPTETDKTNKNPANANASASVFVDVDANAVVDNFETDANVDNFSPVPAKLPTTAVIFVNKNEKYKTRNPNTVVIEKTGAGALKFLELVAETSKKIYEQSGQYFAVRDDKKFSQKYFGREIKNLEKLIIAWSNENKKYDALYDAQERAAEKGAE